MIVVMMGVSGSGKTLIGSMLATRLGISFADADDYHSAANKAKMAAGNALTDEDREPWLQRLNQLLMEWERDDASGVLACSALKEKYRKTLAAGIAANAIHFVWLDAPPAVIASRLEQRHHEYMNPNLLSSQLATLEPPADAVRVVNDETPEKVVEHILAILSHGENQAQTSS